MKKFNVKISGATINQDGPVVWADSFEASSPEAAVKAALEAAVDLGDVGWIEVNGAPWWDLAKDGVSRPLWKL